MTNKEAITFAGIIKSFYPNDFKYEDTTQAILRGTTIYNLFKDYDYDLVYKTFHNLTLINPKWCPSLAEIEVKVIETEKKILLKRLNDKYGSPYEYDAEKNVYYSKKGYDEELYLIESGKVHLKDINNEIKRIEAKNGQIEINSKNV